MPDEIAATNFGRVNSKCLGSGINQTFKAVDDLRSAGAAIGAGRYAICENAAKSQKDLRYVIHAANDTVACRRGDRRTERRKD